MTVVEDFEDDYFKICEWPQTDGTHSDVVRADWDSLINCDVVRADWGSLINCDVVRADWDSWINCDALPAD